MAVFKCKMCGGDLDVVDGMSVAECEYCGTKQTLPKLNDNEKEIMYDRAGHFRRNNEFDKAMGIYEKILDIDNTDAEAYWSLVLCEYGIEYVEDPSTHKRVPTVNRAQFTSVFMNENYKSAIQYADAYQRSIYEEEAKNIDNIQKGILEISQNEEPFDVFICYKETDEHGRRTHDSVLANDLYHQLTQEGFKVFFSRITLEDKLGTAYEPYIFAALNSAKVMVVIGTKPEYFNAVWVKNEWVRFLAQIKNGVDKILIPAYKDMDPYDLPEEFSNLQAQDMSKLGFMQDLIRGVKKITQKDKKENVVIQVADKGHNDAENMVKRAYIALEDGDFKSANDFAEKALDKDAENAQAYIIQLLVELSLRKEADLEKHNIPLENYKKYIRAYGFAQSEYKDLLSKYNKGSFEVYFNETEKKIDITKSSEDLKKILQELDEFSESDRKSALVNKINQKIINNKNEYSIKINSKNEYFLLKNIIKIDKNLDLIEGLDELYYLEKLDIKNIFLELNKIKNNYDYIFIDTYSEILFNENLEILNNCDDIIFLLKLNELELNKAKVMFNIIKNKWKINKNRIKIIIYRNKIFDYIFYYKYIKKYIEVNNKILGCIHDYYFINLYYKNKIINKIINLKFKINSIFILKNINREV